MFRRLLLALALTSTACTPLSARDLVLLDVVDRDSGQTLPEYRHRGEVCFVVEAELTTAQLWAGLAARARARELFAAQGVWNTEENNGVLIYVLLAERRVEIVADRGIDARVSTSEWQAICDSMDAHFRAGRYRSPPPTPNTSIWTDCISLISHRFRPRSCLQQRRPHQLAPLPSDHRPRRLQRRLC